MAGGRIVRPEEQTGINLPRVGLIKTGYKDERGYPKSTDYFLASGKYKAIFDKYYPNNPKTLQIVFWEDNPETMCNERYEYRDKAGKLFARGDGTNFEVWVEKEQVYKTFTTEDRPFLMEEIDDKVKNGKGWDIILTLRFLLPKVKDIAGYWQYSTKGTKSTIPAVRDTFDAMLEGRGFVRGIIFDLNVEFAKSQKPGSKSRYPVVSLIPNQSRENISALEKSLLSINNQNLLENGNEGS